jgi:DNA polymerase
VTELLAGQCVPAGFGYATILPDIDVETYSQAGYVWNAGSRKWDCLPHASQGKKGLPVTGAACYAEHPTAELLMLAYDLKDGRGRRRWRQGQPLPADLVDHIQRGQLLEAHNAGFERKIWSRVAVKLGFPPLRPDQLRCSMAKCRAWSLPPALDDVAGVLQTPIQKDKRGKALMNIFSMPRNPTKADPRTRIRLDDAPSDALDYQAYNETDIAAEAEVSRRVPDLPAPELEYWLLDQAINERGVHIDRESAQACADLVEQALEFYNIELRQLTGIDAASKVQQILGWLAAHNVYLTSLDEESVELALKHLRATPLVDDSVRFCSNVPICTRVLEIRATVGSASVKKVFAILNQATLADRLHDLFTFHGARTGRPTGNGPQPTNLPNSGPECYQCAMCTRWYPAPRTTCPHCNTVRAPDARKFDWNVEAADDALDIIRSRNLQYLERIWGDAMGVISGCLRGLFTAAPGHDLVGSDYSAIEAVVNAMLSGEQWRIDVFRTHGKIYEASASQMFKVPLQTILDCKATTGDHHPLRKKGKIAELAFGYMGWLGSAKAFDMPGTDEEIIADILAWRHASPSIVFLAGGQKAHPAIIAWHRQALAAGGMACSGPTWEAVQAQTLGAKPWDNHTYLHGMEGMAIAAIQNPGYRYAVHRLDGTFSGLTWFVYDRVLYMELPSGRRIPYHQPRIYPAPQDWRGLAITFKGWNTNPKKGPYGWIDMPLYAGICIENACQAVANDIQRHGKLRQEAAGYPIVLHVYDENVAEIPEGFGSVEEFEREMNTMPPWATGWPIFARGGWRGKRFRK